MAVVEGVDLVVMVDSVSYLKFDFLFRYHVYSTFMFLMMMYMMQVDILILVDVDVVESVSYLHCCDLFHYSTVLTINLLNNDVDHSAGFGSSGVVMIVGGWHGHRHYGGYRVDPYVPAARISHAAAATGPDPGVLPFYWRTGSGAASRSSSATGAMAATATERRRASSASSSSSTTAAATEASKKRKAKEEDQEEDSLQAAIIEVPSHLSPCP